MLSLWYIVENLCRDIVRYVVASVKLDMKEQFPKAADDVLMQVIPVKAFFPIVSWPPYRRL